MFPTLKHVFQSLKHKFQSLELKFQSLKHKIPKDTKTFSQCSKKIFSLGYEKIYELSPESQQSTFEGQISIDALREVHFL